MSSSARCACLASTMSHPLLSRRQIVAASPARWRWLLWLLLPLSWVAVGWGGFHWARASLGPDCLAMEASRDQAAAKLVDSERRVQALSSQVAVLERSEQVARGANQVLQAELNERQEEIAALRADVSFYQRLSGGSARREGLAVHDLMLRERAGQGLYGWSLTLSHNLAQARQSEGRIHLSVEGLRDGRLLWLDRAALGLGTGPDEAELRYGFRYFQRIEGSLVLPDDFQPSRIRVRLLPDGGGGEVEQDFVWQDTLTPGERS